MRRIVSGVVETHAGAGRGRVSRRISRRRIGCWPIRAALPQIHQPSDEASLEQAQRRFIYQELLVLQLALAIRKWRLAHQRQAPPLPTSSKIDARITRLFPFELTAGQRQAIDEIAADMARPFPMNRLLQGDVGSGKTVVAMYAMLLAVAHGHQAALMAPTEILARQHLQTLATALAASKVRLALLTGSLTPAERREMLEKIAAGEVDIVIGTHAVTHAVAKSGVEFKKLGLVVIDEQHKFGVRQRAALKKAGIDPHYLVMTATPIPRTVGDDAVRRSGCLHAPRAAAGPADGAHATWPATSSGCGGGTSSAQKLDEGRQGFVIAPLVEEAEAVEAANVQADVRNAEPRRAGELSAGPAARADDAGREGLDDAGLSQRPDAGAGGDQRRRGGRRCAQRHADDDRRGRAVWPGPAPPASRPHQPRGASGLSVRLRHAGRATKRRSGWTPSPKRATASSWPRSTFSSAAPATCSARGSTACRRCGSPTCGATRRSSKKPAGTRRR